MPRPFGEVPAHRRAPLPAEASLLGILAGQDGARTAFVIEHDTGAREAVSLGGFLDSVQRAASVLAQAGLGPGDRLCIHLSNSLTWEVVEKACTLRGAHVVGLELHAPEDRVRELVEDFAPKLVVTERHAELERLGLGVDLLARHQLESALAASSAAPAPGPARPSDGAATSFYFVSSGTTGRPKLVDFTEEQLLLTARTVLAAVQARPEDAVVCWLPLANPFQRVLNLCALLHGAPITIVPDPRELLRALPAARPTVMVAPPRLFVKVRQTLLEGRGRTRALRLLQRLAVKVAERAAQPGWRLLAPTLDALVFRRVRAMFGGSLRLLISGSAKCPVEVLRLFSGMGMPIFEAYGVSENLVPIALNTADAHRDGSVGRVLAPNEVKLSPEGEILVRGPGLTRGTLYPELSRGMTDEGFWRTGDQGYFDEDGFLFVTGRLRDDFKLSTGRKITPSRIEARLSSVEGVAEVVVFGDNQPFAGALVALAEEHYRRDGAQVAPPAEVLQRVGRDITEASRALSSFERVRAVVFTGGPMTIEGGELSLNLKVRRRVVLEKHRDAIQAVYDGYAHARDGELARLPRDAAAWLRLG